MKQIALYLICIFCLMSCDDTIEIPGRLMEINLEKHDMTVASPSNSVTVGVGADKITWYVLRSQAKINGENSILNNTTYKYSDEWMKDVVRYRDTLEGDWFKILKNKEGNLQIDIAKNEFPYERTLTIDVGGFLSLTENLVITQTASGDK